MPPGPSCGVGTAVPAPDAAPGPAAATGVGGADPALAVAADSSGGSTVEPDAGLTDGTGAGALWVDAGAVAAAPTGRCPAFTTGTCCTTGPPAAVERMGRSVASGAAT